MRFQDLTAVYIPVFVSIMLVSGCSSFNKLTKEQVDEFCSHSKEHQDIIMLGLTDNMFEPHSIHVHCDSEYGFPER